MMSAEEEQELRALSEEIANVSSSRWEPRCIARTFASRLEGHVVFTMQAWIDLEAIRSPILTDDDFTDPEQITHAGAAFDLIINEKVPAHEAVLLIESMREAISAAFSMSLPMRHPDMKAEAPSDGFGGWLPLMAFLEAECGKSRAEARSYPVGEALALMATTRRNQGWREAGQPYAQREPDLSTAPE